MLCGGSSLTMMGPWRPAGRRSSGTERIVGSSSAPQDAQLEAMLNPNFNYSPSSGVHSSGGLGGGHR